MKNHEKPEKTVEYKLLTPTLEQMLLSVNQVPKLMHGGFGHLNVKSAVLTCAFRKDHIGQSSAPGPLVRDNWACSERLHFVGAYSTHIICGNINSETQRGLSMITLKDSFLVFMGH